MATGKSVIWGTKKNISWNEAFSTLRQAPLDEDIDAPFCILEGSNGTARILPFEYRNKLHYNPVVTVKTGKSEKQVPLSQAIKNLGPDAKYTLKNIRMAAASFRAQFNDKTREFRQ